MRKRTLHTISAAPPSIHNAFEQFQKQNEVKNLSPETIKFYSAKAKTFFLFLEDVEQRIDTITEEDVEDYILYFKEKGTVSDTTINTNLRMVRAFLYWCMERGYMERFPIRMIRADDTIKEPYTADELERLLKAPDKSTCSFAEYRNWVIVNFLLGTGCRASTLINLRIGDVDLSASTVLFQHMKTRNQIVAPLTRRLGRLLEEYLDYRNGTAPEDPLFISEYGTALSRSTLENAIWAYNHKRGVEKTSIHLFRHTYAKLYIQAGGDPFRLQKLLGHADLTMTRRYVALYADDLKANYDALNPLEQMTHNTRRDNKIKLAK